jgi:hypothetical protein
VLARLNEVGGVLSAAASLGNQGGSLVRVSLRPGANPAEVAEQVRRVLGEEVPERPVEAIAGQSAAAALQQNEWLDTTRLADVAATERGPSERRTPALLALVLGGVGVGLCLLGCLYLWHRRAGRADPALAANDVRPFLKGHYG